GPWSPTVGSQVGLRTMRGTGALDYTRQEIAVARTSCFFEPLSRAEKKTCTWSITSTRMKGLGARVASGAVTPDTEPGKLTWKSLPCAVFAPLYPFKAAY